MLLNFSELLRKYNIKVSGVVQVGTHRGQEHDLYIQHGISKMVYIEPDKENFNILVQRFGSNENVILVNTACGDKEGEEVAHVEHCNQGQSSSLLAPKVHLTQHIEVVFDDAAIWSVIPLDKIPFKRELYNLLNVDVQGYEAYVFRGAKETLKHTDYIFTEVNRHEMYEGCAMIEDLDEMLVDFKRVETGWASENHGWGDALYIRRTLL